MQETNNHLFLFSVDLEDVRLRVENGLSYKARVEALVDRYLEFLDSYDSTATFFTVGGIPKYYPSLIEKIVSQGHEIACHSSEHKAVVNQTKEEFKDDVSRNMESLYNAGAKEIKGYRAPTFSVTPKTLWVYEVLSELGITYSSSVLPAKNPLYGWESFGEHPKKMNSDIWEIPITLRKSSLFKVPFSGGVYFRFLPFYFVKKSFAFRFSNGSAVTSYFHPYDIDLDQERFMHPEINDSPIYNYLMYYNRKKVFSRLHKIMTTFKPKIITYKSYVSSLELENNSNIAS
ncbi:hypothetical protein ATO12_18100 [Aquimarina atlantica]|uniref:NodB homology domain-containing protein n=1 Tax=Aquimarina atlantica TaxID=1317122 RepID=A0A023BSX6_9FLAO|nr:polysaccharide deacetylase family protein [Aquimarina atlantica]EZH72933.1 hypothetical protein ATO12_18100 [Aquimarina atlantica]